MTTGAGNDLERATELARRMVCEWAMSDAMGPLTFGKKEERIFLGREGCAQHQDYSEDTAIRIDQELKRLVMQNYERARGILEEPEERARSRSPKSCSSARCSTPNRSRGSLAGSRSRSCALSWSPTPAVADEQPSSRTKERPSIVSANAAAQQASSAGIGSSCTYGSWSFVLGALKHFTKHEEPRPSLTP